MNIYTSRPKQRQARKAWDKFVHNYNGEEPKELYYCSNYDNEFKGWVCIWQSCKKAWMNQLNYSSFKRHTFYYSNEL